MTDPINCLVSLDLDERVSTEEGFVQWILQHQPAAQPTIAYALAERIGPYVLEAHASEGTRSKLRGRLGEAQQRLGSERVSTRLLHGGGVATMLFEAAEEIGADAVAVARAAPREGFRLVRLGRDLRHLLVRLRKPVIALPADLGRPSDGPIILATDLNPDCEGAARWAFRWAATSGPPLHVAHVVPDVSAAGVEFYSAAAAEEMTARAMQRGQQDLEDWLERHGMADVRRHVLIGETAMALENLAEDEGASMIVLGSNRRGALDRSMFGVTWEVAGGSAVPVTIVPPEWGAGG